MVDITPSEVEKEFEDKEKDFQTRFDRMDRAFKLWDLKAVKYDDAINVTSNSPRTFADSVQTRLSASKRQITIRMAEEEGEDRRDDIGKLERLLEFTLNKADERLVRMLMPPMKDFLIWSSIIRGWKAARILNYKSGKDVVFDYTPLDPRWLVYEVGSKGFIWTGYKTFRSRADLKATYGIDVSSSWWNPFTKDKDSIPIIERWEVDGDKVFNTIACNNQFLKKPTEVKIPSMPILIMPVTNRPPVVGDVGTEFERYGDDIYAANRGIWELKDKFASVWFSHAARLAKQPLLNYYDPARGKTDLGGTLSDPDTIIDIPKGYNEIVASPLKEISPTLVNAMMLIRSWEEQGSLPTLELTSPPPSGTALAIIEEARSKIYGPQLRLLDRFYTAICYLIEEQLIYNKVKVDVKAEKEHKYWGYEIAPIDLKRPHTIKVEHVSTTPWTQMDSYQLADMAKRSGLPDEFIWEHLLRLQDPKGLSDQVAIEIYEHSPEALMLKAVKSLLKKGRGDEAKRLMEMMAQRAMAEETGLRTEAEGQPPPGEVPPGGGNAGLI